MKAKSGASFKPILSAEEGAVQVLQDKKDKHPFSINSFLNMVANTIPESPVEEKKKVCQGETFTFKLDQALADNGGIYLVIEATEGQSNGVTRPQRRDPEDLLPLLLRQLQHRRKVRHHAGRSQVGRCRSRWR